MHGTSNVFLACALGGGTGSLVALQVNPAFWWLGLVTGGFTGYLSYEFNNLVRAVKTVLTEELRSETHSKFVAGLSQLGYSLSLVTSGIVIFVATLALFAFLIMILGVTNIPKPGAGKIQEGLVAMGFVSIVIISIAVAVAGILYAEDFAEEKLGIAEYNKSSKENRSLSLAINPITTIFFWIPLLMLVGLWKILVGIYRIIGITPPALKVMKNLAKKIFIMIHCEIRILCLLDSAIGAAVGYFVGNAIVGALAGGILGVVNFELVSKKWLKVVPDK